MSCFREAIQISNTYLRKNSKNGLTKNIFIFCVEILQPSQPNGVMSSVVSLPNHMFTGQALVL